MKSAFLHITRSTMLISVFLISGFLLSAQSNTDPGIKDLIQRAELHLQNNLPDSTIHYAKMGLEWSTVENDRKNTIECLHLIAKANFKKKNIPVALRYYLQTTPWDSNSSLMGFVRNRYFLLQDTHITFVSPHLPQQIWPD